METPRSHEEEPQESGREMAQRVLGEVLSELAFNETELMQDLRGIVGDAIANDDPLTALTAYARYQEVGDEGVAQAADRDHAQLALNIACARLHAIRGERDRFVDAVADCVKHANALGRTDVADELGYFLT